MGIAIIIPDVSFSGSNIGRVTPIENIPLVSLSVSGQDSVIGRENAAIYTVEYNPSSTTQRGILWSVVSGSTYASIDEGGNLSVLSGAVQASVTIRATSSVNNSIYAEKTITVTYERVFIPLENLTARIYFNGGIVQTDITPQSGDWFKIKCQKPTRLGRAIFFGSRKYSNSDDDSVIFEIDNTGLNYYAMRGKMYGTRYTSSSEIAVDTRYVVEVKASGISSDPSVGTFSASQYNFEQAYPIAIGGLTLANGQAAEALGGIDVFGIEIYDSNNILKHRLIPQSNLTFLDEITGTSYSPNDSSKLIYADD